MSYQQSCVPRDHRSVRKKSFGPWSQRKLDRMQRFLAPIQDQRGFNSEAIVERMLEDFKQQGLVRHFYRTEHYSPQDRRGIDFIVIRNDSSKIILQVKSSQRNIDKFVKKNAELKNNKYEGLFCILVKTDYLVDDQPLREEIKKILDL